MDVEAKKRSTNMDVDLVKEQYSDDIDTVLTMIMIPNNSSPLVILIVTTLTIEKKKTGCQFFISRKSFSHSPEELLKQQN